MQIWPIKRWGGIDPIPDLEIDGKIVRLAPPMQWYEGVWMGLPVLMLFGGVLPVLAGVYLSCVNSLIFRSDRSRGRKYFLTGMITLASLAFAALVLFAIMRLR